MHINTIYFLIDFIYVCLCVVISCLAIIPLFIACVFIAFDMASTKKTKEGKS